MKLELPCRANLVLDGFGGRSYTPITIIRETPKRYEIRNDMEKHAIKLAGRGRWLMPGDTVLVPKTAIQEKA